MAFIRHVYFLLKCDLRDNLKSLKAVLFPIYFAILGLLIFHIALGPYQIPSHYFMAFLYCIQLFATLFAVAFIFERDLENGFIVKLITSGFKPLEIGFAKYIYFVLYSLLIFAISMLVGLAAYNLQLSDVWIHIIIYTCYLPAYSAIMMLFNILLASFENKLGLFIISFPFIAPPLMIATVAFDEMAYVKMLLGLSLIYCALLCASFEGVLREVLKRSRR